MRPFESYRKSFEDFYQAVKRGHEESPRKHRGHGLDHDVTVAMLSVRIAPNPRIAEKAWVASLLHSLDRTVEESEVGPTMRTYLSLLPQGFFTPEEIEEIFTSAMRHSEKNKDDQSLVQQVLMDADRLANLQPTVIIRSGQFLSDIPAVEFEYLGANNPASTYNNPASVLDDLRNNMAEYLPQMRTRAAQRLGGQYARQLEDFIKEVGDIYSHLGLNEVKL